MCVPPLAVSSFMLFFRKNFIFGLGRCVYNMLYGYNVSLFVFMVYTCEVNICNPNLCSRVKVSSAYGNIHRLRDTKNQKCWKKNHNKLQLLDF